jgi:uncharacterized membrane protein (DUF2068 family)
MAVKRVPITYKGRSLGIIVLTSAQILIGIIHAIFGFLLLASENTLLKATVTYDFYTIAFGVLTLVFAWFIWQGKKAGWIGTIAISVFVSIADALAVLNLPTIPGIPKFAAPTEIIYSLAVIIYLSQRHIRKKYLENP